MLKNKSEEKLKTMAVRLEKATGRKTEIKSLNDGSKIIFLDTNYEGPYAPKSTWDAIKIARAVVRRSHTPFQITVHPSAVGCRISLKK